jgi:hypothetical protein
MACLIPKISIEDIRNKPERDVARPLVEGLPDDCLVERVLRAAGE